MDAHARARRRAATPAAAPAAPRLTNSPPLSFGRFWSNSIPSMHNTCPHPRSLPPRLSPRQLGYARLGMSAPCCSAARRSGVVRFRVCFPLVRVSGPSSQPFICARGGARRDSPIVGHGHGSRPHPRDSDRDWTVISSARGAGPAPLRQRQPRMLPSSRASLESLAVRVSGPSSESII